MTRRRLARQLLEGEARGLRDEERGEDAAEHEEREQLHQAVRPRAVVPGDEGQRDDLRDDGAELARRGREAVTRRPVPRREALARHDERGGVGAEVEEELGDDVERQERSQGQVVVGEAEDAEQDGEDEEPGYLQRPAAYDVDGEYRSPVPG